MTTTLVRAGRSPTGAQTANGGRQNPTTRRPSSAVQISHRPGPDSVLAARPGLADSDSTRHRRSHGEPRVSIRTDPGRAHRAGRRGGGGAGDQHAQHRGQGQERRQGRRQARRRRVKSSPATRADKLVATDQSGVLPNDIVSKAVDADRLDGLDSSAFSGREAAPGEVMTGTYAAFGGEKRAFTWATTAAFPAMLPVAVPSGRITIVSTGRPTEECPGVGQVVPSLYLCIYEGSVVAIGPRDAFNPVTGEPVTSRHGIGVRAYCYTTSCNGCGSWATGRDGQGRVASSSLLVWPHGRHRRSDQLRLPAGPRGDRLGRAADRRGDPPGADRPARLAQADRERELRLAGGAADHGHLVQRQVRRGHDRPPLLRRLPERRHRRDDRRRARPRAVRRRSTPTPSRTPASTPTWSRTGRSWPTGSRGRGWRSTAPRTSTTSPTRTGRSCATSSATSGCSA